MKDLYERLKKKDVEAFNIFVDEYTELILKVIHSNLYANYLKDFVLECYNDVLFTIWDKIHLYDCNYKFEAWIATIAKNKSLDYLRKLEKKRNNVECLENIEEVHKNTENNIEELIIIKEDYEDLITNINKLDSLNRKIFTMRFIMDKNIKEITKVTGISEHAVYKRIERLKKRLVNEFEVGENNERKL